MKCPIKISFYLLLVTVFLVSSCKKDDDKYVTENFNSLTLSANSYWNGADNSGNFKASNITFPNIYNAAWSSWSGFAYSNMHDIKTANYGNQYSSYALKDSSSSNTFVVAYPYLTANTVEFDNVVYDIKFKVTNNTFAALSMKNGDLLSKKFGGTDGSEKDWFKLEIIGIDKDDLPTDTANVYLADFRYSDSKQDYIIDEWLPINLAKLGEVKKLKFQLSSSDNNSYGMRTPGYFCLDDLEYKPVNKTE